MIKDIVDILARHHLKWTSAREKILALLIGKARPFSAPELYRYFGKQEDRVTIYRVLDALYKCGVLIKVLDERGVSRFFYSREASLDKPHFQCKDCGCLYGLPALPESYFNSLANYDIQQAVLVFSGICEDCKKNKQYAQK